MGYDPIKIGDAANDRTGDSPRAAAIKANAMFEELYGMLSPSGAPFNTSKPAITGTLITGQTLSATTGNWTGSPTGYTYQWTRNGVAILGASGSAFPATYVLVTADEGQSIRIEVTATNVNGPTVAISDPVVPAAPVISLPRYWGTDVDPDVTNDDIINLFDGDTSTARGASIDFTVSGDPAYVYFLYPASFLDLSAIYVDGNLAFNFLDSAFVKTTKFVTPTGASEAILYNVYRTIEKYNPTTVNHQYV